MKIIHTSDWHIGKKLHDFSLREDLRLFLKWLIEVIREKGVEALLISGDVFDSSNPSSEARQEYYDFLNAVLPLDCKVIITGGNHDSPAVLHAPRRLLKGLGIHVTGALPQNMDELLIPLSENVVVAAIPFLREGELRSFVPGESYDQRYQAIKQAILSVYHQTAQRAGELFPGSQVIAMGHLTTVHAQTSDSERAIHIGNLANINPKDFAAPFAYTALGHIHKPQTISRSKRVYYSGSPVPLSFSEADDDKRIMLIDLAEKEIQAESIPIPRFRKMYRIAGNLGQVRRKLQHFKEEEYPLTGLADVTVEEEKNSPAAIHEFRRIISEFNETHSTQIISQRLLFKEEQAKIIHMYGPDSELAELKPEEVFNRLLDAEDIKGKERKLLLEAFNEVYQKVLSQM